MIQLHYSPGTASMTPHLLLQELGVPFELMFVDRQAGAHKRPEYLALNPNGLIPVLVDGSVVLYETAAIVLHLADTHPQAALAPPLGTPERAQFYKWAVWLSATLQSMLMHHFYGERMVAPGNAGGAAEVSAQAEARAGPMLDQIDAHLASHGGPWMMGAHFSALDPYTFMLCRWTRGFGRPARALPHIAPFLQRMLERPAVRKVLATEGLQAPFV
jgi:glutathione S-transferase